MILLAALNQYIFIQQPSSEISNTILRHNRQLLNQHCQLHQSQEQNGVLLQGGKILAWLIASPVDSTKSRGSLCECVALSSRLQLDDVSAWCKEVGAEVHH